MFVHWFFHSTHITKEMLLVNGHISSWVPGAQFPWKDQGTLRFGSVGSCCQEPCRQSQLARLREDEGSWRQAFVS